MGKQQKFNYVTDVFKVFKNWRNLLKQVKDGEDKEDELLKVCEKLYKKWPKYAASRNVEALIWKTIWQGKVSEQPEAAIPSAMEYYRKLIDIVKDPKIQAELYIHLGDLYNLESNACTDAKRAFEKSLSLSPDFSVAHQRLGLCHAERGNDLKALYHLASSMCCPSPCRFSKPQFRSVFKKYDPSRAGGKKDKGSAEKDEVPSPSKQSTSNASDAGTDYTNTTAATHATQKDAFGAALLRCLSLLGRKGQGFPAAKTALTNLVLPRSKAGAEKVHVGGEEMAEAVYLCLYLLLTSKGLVAKRQVALVLAVCIGVMVKEVKQGRYAAVATGVLSFFGHHEAEKDVLLKAGRHNSQMLENLMRHLVHHLQAQATTDARGPSGRRTPVATLSAWTDTSGFIGIGSVGYTPKHAPEQRDISVFASCFPFVRLQWNARKEQLYVQPVTAKDKDVPSVTSTAASTPVPGAEPTPAPVDNVPVSSLKNGKKDEAAKSVRVSIQEPEFVQDAPEPSRPQAHVNVANDRDVAEWRFRLLEHTCGASVVKYVKDKSFRERSVAKDGKEKERPVRASSQRSRKERREEREAQKVDLPSSGPGSATTASGPGSSTVTPSQERSRRDKQKDKRRGASAPGGTVSARNATASAFTPTKAAGTPPEESMLVKKPLIAARREDPASTTPSQPVTPATSQSQKTPIELPPPASASLSARKGTDGEPAPGRRFGGYGGIAARPLTFEDDEPRAAESAHAVEPSPSPFRSIDAPVRRRFATSDAAGMEEPPMPRRFGMPSGEADEEDFVPSSIQMSRRAAGRRYGDHEEEDIPLPAPPRARAYSQNDINKPPAIRKEESTTEDEDVTGTPPKTPRQAIPYVQSQSESPEGSDENTLTDDEAESEGDDEEGSEDGTESDSDDSDILLARPYDLVSEHGTFRGALSENGDVLTDDDMLSQGMLSACFSFVEYAGNRAPRTCSIASLDEMCVMAPPREAPSPISFGCERELEGMFDDAAPGPRGEYTPFHPATCALEYELAGRPQAARGPSAPLSEENLSNLNNLMVGQPNVPSRAFPHV